MNTIKLLPRGRFAASVDPKGPKCEEPISLITQALGRGRNKKHRNKCANFAELELNGRMLCLRHAQQEVLKILLFEAKT